ncbi:cupin domain-containing protein [Schlesneria paludicola]|uniref:cupin domain-containing protein n=1 Tax=Schlesneria paludicola TaxID=360056 RepID=UPI00029A44FC|nr:cupin domain-containing protein [Schlesneria paludicola]
MGFIDISEYQPIEPVPGCRMRTPFGKNMMLSYLEMDPGSEVPMHSHPHEQGGMLIQGTLQLTIGDETRLCQPGSMFLIPPNVMHRAVAVDGKCVVLDVFSPVREDYAKLTNTYIPPVETPSRPMA